MRENVCLGLHLIDFVFFSENRLNKHKSAYFDKFKMVCMLLLCYNKIFLFILTIIFIQVFAVSEKSLLPNFAVAAKIQFLYRS